jgi:alpha-tubulin suppressor-like RCC1 family protein
LRLLSTFANATSELAGAGRDGRLYTCSSSGKLSSYKIDASGGLQFDGNEIGGGLIGRCTSVAVSSDGTTIYATGLSGFAAFQVDAVKGTITFKEQLSTGATYRVATSPELVVVQDIQENVGYGNITVYSAGDLSSKLAVFSHLDPKGVPLGFAIVGSGVVVQRRTMKPDIGEVHAAEYYTLGALGATLVSRYEFYQRAQTETSFDDLVKLTAQGNHLVTQPIRRVLHLDANTGAFSERPGLEQGHLEWLLPAGTGNVLARGTHSAHYIDVSNPKSPRLTAGGYLPSNTHPLQIELAGPTTLVPTLGPLKDLGATTDVISLTRMDAGAPNASVGSVRISNGRAFLSQEGSSLFALKPESAGLFSLREYSLRELQPGVDQVLPLVQQVSLNLENKNQLSLSPTRELYRINASGSDSGRFVLQRFRRGLDGLSSVGERSFSGGNAIVRATANAVLLVIDRRYVHILENTPEMETLATFAVTDDWTKLTSVLRFNEHEVVLNTLSEREEPSTRYGVLVLRVPDLARISHYQMQEPVISMAQVGQTLAFAMGNQLVTASPRCPAVPESMACPSKGSFSCGDTSTVQICSETSGNWEPYLRCVDPCVDGKCLSVVELKAGHTFACARLNNGSLRCWGDSRSLGANLNAEVRDPVTVLDNDKTSLLGSVESIATGAQHACAIVGGGSLRCWGIGYYGELGNNSTKSKSINKVAATVLGEDLMPLTGVYQVAAKGHNTCVLMNDGTVRCFGSGVEGQLGNGESGRGITYPTAVPVIDPSRRNEPLSDVQEVSVGYLHSCALLADTTVRCWGNNELGQLGNHRSGVNERSAVPVVVLGPDGTTPLSDVRKLVVGYTHSCALLNDGTAVCWGENTFGQLGHTLATGVTSSDLPVVVTDAFGNAMNGIVQLDAGWAETCALLENSTVQCFGSGQNGERGDGIAGSNHYGPVPSVVLDSAGREARGIVEISLGFGRLYLRNQIGAVIRTEGSDSSGDKAMLPTEMLW